MADPVRRPGDVSGFNTYRVPASAEVGVERRLEAGLPPELEMAQDVGAAAVYRRSNPALNQTAERIGVLLGIAVNIARSLSSRVQAVPEKISSLGERIRERSEELRDDVSEAAREWQQTARVRAQRARAQTMRYAHENPFQVIVAVAGFAFALGVGLRIWRSNLE